MKARKPGKETLRNGKKIIGKHFTDAEWATFKTGAENEPSAERSSQMQQYIHDRIAELADGRQQRRLILARFSPYLSAACIALAIGIAIWFGFNHSAQELSNPSAISLPKPKTAKQVDAIWQEINNSSASIREVQLPDLSVVSLYPSSSIKFNRKFNGKFRDVYLDGKAKFKVSHNRKRPFSVFAGDLKTTALGTSFTINTNAPQKRVSVKLHTGKIVVKNTNYPQPPTYISTVGSVLIYNPETRIAAVNKINRPLKSVQQELIRKGNSIEVRNIPLGKVMELLKENYHVQVQVRDADIDQISYTGTVNIEKETVEQVLQVICLINNLTFDKENPELFIIQKSNK